MRSDSIIRVDAIYARQSIDKADSISVESQIDFCKYETRGGRYKVFSDKGYSGKNIDRPGFQQMLKEIRAGNIGRVICYKLDRCSRSILDFTSLMEEFQKYGVEFISCTEKFDTSTPMGRAMLNICIVFAQLERETIQQRVTDAYHSRSKKGFYMGGKVPFGFHLVPCDIEGKRSACYEADATETQILRFMYEEYVRSEASLGDVILALKEAGISNPRRSDGRWVRSHIGRMLANPIYVKADMDVFYFFRKQGVQICNPPEDFVGTNGCYLYRKKDGICSLVLAPHGGIISSDIWLRCRKKHTSTAKSTSCKTQSSWLVGKLRCACCGCTLTISTTRKNNGRVYQYIVCPQSYGSQCCCSGLRGWKLDTAESIMSQLLKKRVKAEFSQLKQNTSRSPERNALNIRITQLQCEIEKAAAKALKSGEALLPYLNQHVENLERKKSELLRCLENNRTEIKKEVTPDYDFLWEKMSVKDKAELVQRMIACIQLSDTTVHVIWNL